MKKIMIHSALVFVACLISGQLFAAQNFDQSFAQANTDYRNGNYKEALAAYQNLAKQKPQADIFYNLGNAAFKNKEIGLAIVNYERARRIDPRNADILENLKLAKSLVQYRVEDKRSWYHQKLVELLEMIRLEELLALSLSVYLVFAVLIFVRIVSKQQPVLTELSTMILWIVIITSVPTAAKFYKIKMQQKAVITSPQAEARFAPSEKDKVAFRLTEGILTDVADRVGSWYRISLVSGDTGWIQESDMTII